MPANTSPAHQLGMRAHPIARLVSVTGAIDLVTPRDVEQQAAAGGFFWLDLESLDGDLLGQFGRSLRLDTLGYGGARGHRPAIGCGHGYRARQAAAVPDRRRGHHPGAGIGCGRPGSGRRAYPGPGRVHGAVPADRAFRAVPGAGAGASPV